MKVFPGVKADHESETAKSLGKLILASSLKVLSPSSEIRFIGKLLSETIGPWCVSLTSITIGSEPATSIISVVLSMSIQTSSTWY